MPHYSDESYKLSKLTTVDNNIEMEKVGPGTYRKFYYDKNGELKEEKIVYHDQKAVENAKKVDTDIKNAEKQIINYDLHQNKLDTALKKKEAAEDRLYKAEEQAKKAEQNLTEKENALTTANKQLSNAESANDDAQAERDEAYAALSSMDPSSPEFEDAVARCDAADALCDQTENNVINAESAVNDAQIDYDAAEAENNEAQAEREAAFDDFEDANDFYEEMYNEAIPEPDYTKKDIEIAKNQTANTRSSAAKYGLGQAAIDGGTRKNPGDDVVNRFIGNKVTIKANDLFDLRNLPGGINFRGIGKAQNTISNEHCILSPSRSFYLSDYRFAESLTITEDLITNPKVQPIILNEFQPYDMLSPADVLDGIGNLLIKTINSGAGVLATPIVKAGSYFISKYLIDRYSTDTAKIYGKGDTRTRTYFTTDPVQVVQNMFNGGRWLNTYELPYFGGSYLKANYSNNWTLGDSSGFLGAMAGGDKEIGTKMLGIDFPSNPKFKAHMEQGRDPISLEFYLINSDNTWLKRNFQFLNAIYAGSNWLHMKFCFIRPPNVYHVICPGRFQIYWAAIDVTVTFEGKLRRNEVVSKELMEYSKAISPDMLWPDAWKMSIQIKDLTPNNFNLYAEYYKNGFNAKEIASLENVFGVTDMFNDAKAYFNELQTEMKPAIDAAKKLAETATAELKEIGSMLDGTTARKQQAVLKETQAKTDLVNAKAAKELGVTASEYNKMVQEKLKSAKYQDMIKSEYNQNSTWYGSMTGHNQSAQVLAETNAKTRAEDEVKRELKAKKAAEAKAVAEKENNGAGGKK